MLFQQSIIVITTIVSIICMYSTTTAFKTATTTTNIIQRITTKAKHSSSSSTTFLPYRRCCTSGDGHHKRHHNNRHNIHRYNTLSSFATNKRMPTSASSLHASTASTPSEEMIIPSTYQYQSLRFCDIGANLLDERYMEGIYRGTYRHVPDIEQVIQRAIQNNVRHIIITAGTIEESRRAIQQTRQWNQQYHPNHNIHFSCTVGVHPTRCAQVFCHPDITTTTTTALSETSNTLEYASMEQQEMQESYAKERIQELYDLCLDGIQDNTVVAYGECGLDYDRLEFCSKPIQQYYLKQQLLEIALPLNLPLFLHNRNVQDDLLSTLRSIQDQYYALPKTTTDDIDANDDDDDKAPSSSATKSYSPLQLNQWDGTYRGVVHSFDDTIELAMLFIQQLHLYIGINGCSLRTEQNIQTIQQLPLDRILLETDCPYCDVRSTHIGYQYIQTHSMNQNSQSEKKFIMGQMVKSRQEPCHIIQIAEIIAGIQQQDIQVVANTCYDNSLRLFGFQE